MADNTYKLFKDDAFCKLCELLKRSLSACELIDDSTISPHTTLSSDAMNKTYLASNSLTKIFKEDILEMLYLSQEDLETLSSIINDAEVRVDKTYSSSRIYSELNRILEEGKAYTLQSVAKASGASYKFVEDKLDVIDPKYIYIVPAGEVEFELYIYDSATRAIKRIGTTNIDLSDYYTRTETDNKFALLTDITLMNAAIGDITTLKTTAKSLVTAINEVKNDIKEIETYEELTQDEYDALTDEEKNNGTEYRTTDTGHIYKNGTTYGSSKPIEVTREEYENLKASGKLYAGVDYLVVCGINDETYTTTASEIYYETTNIPEKNVRIALDTLFNEMASLKSQITQLSEQLP